MATIPSCMLETKTISTDRPTSLAAFELTPRSWAMSQSS